MRRSASQRRGGLRGKRSDGDEVDTHEESNEQREETKEQLEADEKSAAACGPSSPPSAAAVAALPLSVDAAPAAVAASSRLVLSKLVLENFKSYGGVVEVGPFHSSFSSVVGPNGSGKSNVIDALLFVFGYRASQIRLKKLSELIHSSASSRNLPSCSVSVHFHLVSTDASARPLPGSAFVLTRTASRSSDSVYYLDGSRVPYSAVSSLLRSHGVDLEQQRFLILQGEVEAIAMMKPKGALAAAAAEGGAAAAAGGGGMLEYLEDIIGSSRHVPRLQALELELEAATALRTEKLSRLKLVEKEKAALEAAKDEAVAFLRKQAEAAALRAKLLQLSHLDCWTELRRLTADRRRLEAERAAEAQTVSEAAGQLRRLQAEHESCLASHSAVSAELRRVKADFAAAERKDIKYREDIKHRKQRQRRIAAKQHKAKAEKESTAAAMREDEARLLSASKELQRLQSERAALEREVQLLYSRMKAVMEPIRDELEDRQRLLLPCRQRANEAQQRLDAVSSELQLLTGRREAAEAQRTTVAADWKQKAAELKGRQAERKEAQARHAALASRLSSLSASVQSLQQQETAAQSRQSQLIAEVEEQRAQLQSASSSSAPSQLVSALLAAQRAGRLSGIIGRLGELGIIPARYDVAITTCCPALSDCVVETEQAATAAIAFLKQQQIGRARFIILDKVTLRQQQEAVTEASRAEDGAQRLLDLVQLRPGEERLRAAFRFALGDSLVVDGLDAAMRIAFQQRAAAGSARRGRIVTLEGQLIDAAGTMTGGGAQVSRGAMRSAWTAASSSSSSSSRSAAGRAEGEQELQSLESGLQAAEQRLAELVKQRQEAQREAKEAQRESEAAAAALQRLSREAEELQAAATGLQERLAQLETAASSSSQEEERQLRRLSLELPERETAVGKAKKECAGLEAEVAAIEQRCLRQGGAAMREKQQRLQEVSAACDAAEADIGRLQVGREAAGERVQRLERDEAEAEQEERAVLAELATLAEAKAQLEDDALAVLREYKAAQAEVEEKERRMAEVKAELERLQLAADARLERQQELELKAEELDNRTREQQSRELAIRKKLRDTVTSMQRDREEDGLDELLGMEGADAEQQQQSGSGSSEQQAPAAAAAAAGSRRPKRGGRKAVQDAEHAGEEDGDAAAAYVADSELSAEEIASLRLCPLPELRGLERAALTSALSLSEQQLASLKPDHRAIADWQRASADCQSRTAEVEAVSRQREELRRGFDSLRTQRLSEFMGGFRLISVRLREMYQMLTLGGDAELELVDSLDPFSEGVSFSVRPPKKSWKQICNLSGGEKTLSSLALVFALHSVRPTPLYVMDEIDAALDFRNVSIVASYIRERTRCSAQFLIVSLRNNMFEQADRLVGIYKVHDSTRSVTIDPNAFTMPTNSSSSSAAEHSDDDEQGELMLQTEKDPPVVTAL